MAESVAINVPACDADVKIALAKVAQNVTGRGKNVGRDRDQNQILKGTVVPIRKCKCSVT
jgi:hypothetical protein